MPQNTFRDETTLFGQWLVASTCHSELMCVVGLVIENLENTNKPHVSLKKFST